MLPIGPAFAVTGPPSAYRKPENTGRQAVQCEYCKTDICKSHGTADLSGTEWYPRRASSLALHKNSRTSPRPTAGPGANLGRERKELGRQRKFTDASRVRSRLRRRRWTSGPPTTRGRVSVFPIGATRCAARSSIFRSRRHPSAFRRASRRAAPGPCVSRRRNPAPIRWCARAATSIPRRRIIIRCSPRSRATA